MKKYILIIIAFTSLGFIELNAQQDAMYTQYFFNGMTYNPAYAGSRDALSIAAFYRNQWVNIEGAPKTISATIHAPIGQKVGVGLNFENDQIGVIQQNRIFANYAYKLPVGEGTLAMGLKAGVSLYNADYSSVTTIQENDPTYMDDVNLLLPNFGAGLYYYTQKIYAGIAVPHLIQNKLEETESSDVSRTPREEIHYFGTVGGVIPLGESVKIRPSVLVKYVQNSPLEADFNVNFILKDRIWLGASYRTFASYNFNILLQATQQLRIGYAYDLTNTELSNYTSGSHEIFLGYDVVKKTEKIITPRYF